MRLIVKIATDSLPASKVICLAAWNPADEMLYTYGRDDPIEAGFAVLDSATEIVIHHPFVLTTLQDLYAYRCPPTSKIVDTMKICQRRIGRTGNSLRAWAKRFGAANYPAFRGADAWSAEAQAHCVREINYIHWLYLFLDERGLLA